MAAAVDKNKVPMRIGHIVRVDFGKANPCKEGKICEVHPFYSYFETPEGKIFGRSNDDFEIIGGHIAY